MSVIVPLYNKGPFIERALGSILSQDHRDLEVLVVDDGSTDEGPQVAARCADPRVRLLRQTNAGPGAARNRGLAEARFPLVAFLDADDEWLPGFLERSVRRLREHPGCTLVVNGYLLGTDRRDCRQTRWARNVEPGPFRLPVDATGHEIFRARNFLFTPGAVLAKKDVLLRYGGFYGREGCSYAEDIYLWTGIILAEAIFRDPEPRLWIHTEVSELGVGRTTIAPMEPLLVEPEPVRARCPPSHREALERFLAWLAARTVRKHAYAGDAATVADLVGRFPRARRHVGDLLVGRLLLAIWPIRRRIRALRARTNGPPR